MTNPNLKSRAGQVSIPLASTIPETVTAEAVTIPAGAAGTLVNFYLQRKPIYDSHNNYIGGEGDTSVVLTSTAFDNEVSSSTLDAALANGDYWIDYITGKGRGRKKDASASQTATYSVPIYNMSIETGDIEIGAVELKDGATDNRAVINAANTARAATDKVVLVQAVDETGAVMSSTTGTLVDDAAFAPATSRVTPAGFFADETATDSVEEGDVGAARMTLDRKQIGASDILDDAAFGIGTGYVNGIGALADETATDSVDEGDIGLVRMTLDRKLITQPEGGVAAGAADTKNPIKVGGKYNATAPTLDDGDRGDVNLDVNSNMQVNQRTLQAGEDLSNNVMATTNRKLASSTYAPLLFTNFGANATLNVKASAGNVFAVSAYNTNAAARFIQIHNTATVPAGAAVPLISHLVPAGTEVILGEDFFSQAGLNFTTGIAFAMSTTLATYTAATAAEGFVEVHYL